MLCMTRAVATFDAMKRLPFYSRITSWLGPYDVNFNEDQPRVVPTVADINHVWPYIY